ncbi:MAG: hypothetical protein V4722_09085 [Bacteroidota bacterium]
MKKAAIVFLMLVLLYPNPGLWAQPKVEKLEFGKTLTSKLDNAGAVKQAELLTDIIKSAATNFVNHKGKMTWDNSAEPGEAIGIHHQIFESTLKWPGQPSSTIECEITTVKNTPTYEKWLACFTFYDEQDGTEALKIFNRVYNQVNEAIVSSASGKTYILKAPLTAPKADNGGQKKASIYFGQLYDTEKIQVVLSFEADEFGYYTIDLKISKSNFKK